MSLGKNKHSVYSVNYAAAIPNGLLRHCYFQSPDDGTAERVRAFTENPKEFCENHQ